MDFSSVSLILSTHYISLSTNILFIIWFYKYSWYFCCMWSFKICVALKEKIEDNWACLKCLANNLHRVCRRHNVTGHSKRYRMSQINGQLDISRDLNVPESWKLEWIGFEQWTVWRKHFLLFATSSYTGSCL